MDFAIKIVENWANDASLDSSEGTPLEIRLDYTVEDLKELIDAQITKGKLPICRMWLEVLGADDALISAEIKFIILSSATSFFIFRPSVSYVQSCDHSCRDEKFLIFFMYILFFLFFIFLVFGFSDFFFSS